MRKTIEQKIEELRLKGRKLQDRGDDLLQHAAHLDMLRQHREGKKALRSGRCIVIAGNVSEFFDFLHQQKMKRGDPRVQYITDRHQACGCRGDMLVKYGSWRNVWKEADVDYIEACLRR